MWILWHKFKKNLYIIMKILNSKMLFNDNILSSSEVNQEVSTETWAPDELPTSVRAIIDGTEVEFIPAFTNYSMELPKKKDSLLKSTDSSKRMDVIFHFTVPRLFWDENITLYDRNGNAIHKGTPNVLAVCDMADTYWRLFLDDVLTNVQVHEFESVKEYAQTIGNSMLLSRGLNNVEKVGYAALATGNEAYKAVFEFAKKNNVPMNTAQLYLDLQLKASTTQLMMLGKEPKMVPTIGRTQEKAQELYDQNVLTFSKGGANKRYAIRVVNSLLKKSKYTFEDIIEALRTIPANEIAIAELQGCAEKEMCIMETLSSWMLEMKRKSAELKVA